MTDSHITLHTVIQAKNVLSAMGKSKGALAFLSSF